MSSALAGPAEGVPDTLRDAVVDAHPAAAVLVLDGRARLMLTVDEAAGLCGVNRRVICELIAAGTLPALNLYPGGGRAVYRIAVQALLALIPTDTGGAATDT